MKHEEITEEIIRIFYKVYNILGYGFLEKVYERAMAIEFEKIGIEYKSQYPIKVFYDDKIVGDYIADFIIEDKVIVEIKAIREWSGTEGKQILNYLRCTDKDVGLILNFGIKPEIKRRIYEDSRKAI